MPFEQGDPFEVQFSVITKGGSPVAPTGGVRIWAAQGKSIVNATDLSLAGTTVTGKFNEGVPEVGRWVVRLDETLPGFSPDTLGFVMITALPSQKTTGAAVVLVDSSPPTAPAPMAFDLTLNGDTLTAGNGSLTLTGDILEVA